MPNHERPRRRHPSINWLLAAALFISSVGSNPQLASAQDAGPNKPTPAATGSSSESEDIGNTGGTGSEPAGAHVLFLPEVSLIDPQLALANVAANEYERIVGQQAPEVQIQDQQCVYQVTPIGLTNFRNEAQFPTNPWCLNISNENGLTMASLVDALAWFFSGDLGTYLASLGGSTQGVSSSDFSSYAPQWHQLGFYHVGGHELGIQPEPSPRDLPWELFTGAVVDFLNPRAVAQNPQLSPEKRHRLATVMGEVWALGASVNHNEIGQFDDDVRIGLLLLLRPDLEETAWISNSQGSFFHNTTYADILLQMFGEVQNTGSITFETVTLMRRQILDLLDPDSSVMSNYIFAMQQERASHEASFWWGLANPTVLRDASLFVRSMAPAEVQIYTSEPPSLGPIMRQSLEAYRQAFPATSMPIVQMNVYPGGIEAATTLQTQPGLESSLRISAGLRTFTLGGFLTPLQTLGHEMTHAATLSWENNRRTTLANKFTVIQLQQDIIRAHYPHFSFYPSLWNDEVRSTLASDAAQIIENDPEHPLNNLQVMFQGDSSVFQVYSWYLLLADSGEFDTHSPKFVRAFGKKIQELIAAKNVRLQPFVFNMGNIDTALREGVASSVIDVMTAVASGAYTNRTDAELTSVGRLLLFFQTGNTNETMSREEAIGIIRQEYDIFKDKLTDWNVLGQNPYQNSRELEYAYPEYTMATYQYSLRLAILYASSREQMIANIINFENVFGDHVFVNDINPGQPPTPPDVNNSFNPLVNPNGYRHVELSTSLYEFTRLSALVRTHLADQFNADFTMINPYAMCSENGNCPISTEDALAIAPFGMVSLYGLLNQMMALSLRGENIAPVVDGLLSQLDTNNQHLRDILQKYQIDTSRDDNSAEQASLYEIPDYELTPDKIAKLQAIVSRFEQSSQEAREQMSQADSQAVYEAAMTLFGYNQMLSRALQQQSLVWESVLIQWKSVDDAGMGLVSTIKAPNGARVNGAMANRTMRNQTAGQFVGQFTNTFE